MINIDRYQGDPALFLSENGSRMIFKGGQAILDAGFENAVKISLMTKQGWIGNDLFRNENKKVGSDFLKINEGSITLQGLNLREQSAKKALQWMIDSGIAQEIEVAIENPTGYILDYYILIKPPGKTAQELFFTKNGSNWIAQRFDPAHERV